MLLACVGVALALGVVASSAPARAPSYAEPKTYATGDGPHALASGDLNGDGTLDLVTANGNAISVLLNPAWEGRDGHAVAALRYGVIGAPAASEKPEDWLDLRVRALRARLGEMRSRSGHERSYDW